MTTRSRVWFALFVALVFVMGSLTGLVLDRLWLVRDAPPLVGGGPLGVGLGRRPAGPQPAQPAAIDRQLRLLDRTLDLTTSQHEALAEILERWHLRALDLQTDARQQFATEQAALFADLAEVLTPEQNERLRRSRLGRDLGRQGPPGDGPARNGRGRE